MHLQQAAGPVILSAILFLLLDCSMEQSYDSYAIVYGISYYTDPTIRDLQYCDNDAQELAALLASQGYQVTVRINEDATRMNLEGDIMAVREAAGTEDLFLLFFSGHGGQNRELPGKAGEPPLADSHTEAIYLNDVSGVYKLEDDELADLIDSIPSRMKVLLIDACNSGGFIGNTLEFDRIPADYDGSREDITGVLEGSLTLFSNYGGSFSDISPDTALVIGASGEPELTFEQDSLTHGLFTYFLLESALEGDSNEDGTVTALEAFAYARDGIENNWNVHFSSAVDIFSPRVSGGPLDFVLFRSR